MFTGMFKAWNNGTFRSRNFRQGLFAKAGFLFVLILAYQMDVMAGNSEPIIRTVTAMYYIGVEGTSLIENLGEIGVPIPQVIRKHLKVFTEKDTTELEKQKT